jgi:antibiotic biosynthesis monooxygenase (ABM) superfamily enzyme
MTIRGIFAGVVLAVVLSLALNATWADEAVPYLPVKGDEVVVYIHRFKPEQYEKGRDLVERGFSAAITAHDQTRRTIFLEDEASHEVMAVSFFHASASAEKWHASAERKAVLDQLEAMRREPLIVKRYVVGLHHVHHKGK